VHGSLDVVTARFVAAAHARGVRVLPWTLNFPDEFRTAVSAGSDGINTNAPDTLLDWLKAPR